MKSWEKKENIRKANLIIESKHLWGPKIETLSEDHIKYVLGIELPLNESYYANPELVQKIIYEQMLYENILTQIADFAKEKVNAVITTIKDWKETAAVLLKILKDPKLLNTFLTPLARRFEAAMQPIQNKIKSLGKVGEAILKAIDGFVKKIEALEPWKKLFAYIGIGSIALLISTKLSSEGFANEVLGMITNYFSDNFFKDLVASFTGWAAFMSFINTLTGVSKVLFNFLGELIQKFKSAMDAEESGDKYATILVK